MTHTYDPNTAPTITAQEAIAQGTGYYALVSAARFHERQVNPRGDRRSNPASKTLARRLRSLAREVQDMTGYPVRRAANDNRKRRRAA